MFPRHAILRRVGSAALALLGSACSSTPMPDAMRREAVFGPPSEVVDAAATFQASLSVPFEQETDSEGIHEIEIPLEGSVPITCIVWPEEAEMGATALRTSRRILENLTASGIAISEHQVVSLVSGAIDDTAYQSVKSVFRMASGDEVGGGLMKVAAANKHGRGIACNHWDAGYVETFDRVFEELVRSFRARDPGPEPYYKEIARVRLGELAVGVVTTTFTRDAEGDVQGISETSSLIPRSESEFNVSYSKTTDWSKQDGDLLNSYEVETDLDAEHTNLALKWDRERGWHVAGMFQGKQIEADLGHDGVIDSMLSDLLVAKYRLVPRGERSELALARWIPGADPTRVIEAAFRVDAEDARRLTLKHGNVEMRALRDADGLPETITFDLPNATMTLERIYQHGEV